MDDEDSPGGKATGTPPSVGLELKHQKPVVLSPAQDSQGPVRVPRAPFSRSGGRGGALRWPKGVGWGLGKMCECSQPGPDWWAWRHTQEEVL